jgi:hypothetical protein
MGRPVDLMSPSISQIFPFFPDFPNWENVEVSARRPDTPSTRAA